MNHAADYSYAEIANNDPAFAQVSGLHWLKLEYEYKPVVYDFGSIFTDNKITHTDACGWIAVSGAIEMMVKYDETFCKRDNVVHQARDEIMRSMYYRGSTSPKTLKAFTGNSTTNCRITDAEFEHLAIILGVKIAVLEMRGTDDGPEMYINRSFGFQHFASQISIFQNGYSHFVVVFDARLPEEVSPEYRALITNYNDIPDVLKENVPNPIDPDAYGRAYDDHDDYEFELEAFEDECEAERENNHAQTNADSDLAFVLQMRETAEAAEQTKQFEEDARLAVEIAEREHSKHELEHSKQKLERVATVARSRFNPNAKPWGRMNGAD
jgi:hypothetical protein